MLAAFSAWINRDVLSRAANLTPVVTEQVSEKTEKIKKIASSAIETLVNVTEPFTERIIIESVPLATPKSTKSFLDFKHHIETAPESVLKHLQSTPCVSKSCSIEAYLQITQNWKQTYKSYHKLSHRWGYKNFHRIQNTGLKGVATAFIMNVILEDGIKSTSMIYDQLLTYFDSILKSKKYPAHQDNLKKILESLRESPSILDTIYLEKSSSCIDLLSSILVDDFCEKIKEEKDTSFEVYISLIKEEPLKKDLLETLSFFKKLPLSPLTNILGPKQSFFGPDPLKGFNTFKEALPTILDKVKKKLKDESPASFVKEWLDGLEPIQLLTAFESTPIGAARKDSLKLEAIKLFKEEIKSFVESKKELLQTALNKEETAQILSAITHELGEFDWGYLQEIYPIDAIKLFQLAQYFELFKQSQIKRQTNFAHYLANSFQMSFTIHSWDICSKDKEQTRLTLRHIGSWHNPSCHILFFPEGEESRIDLLKSQGLYAPRSTLIELVQAHSFKKLEKQRSSTLADITSGKIEASSENQALAANILYYRLHIFACLQKLIYEKLPLLKDKERYDAYGNKEDDSASYNPFGEDDKVAEPHFHSKAEAQIFRLSKHLLRLNEEIAELHCLADSVFYYHSDILTEIKGLLAKAKKTICEFYISKIPDFIENLKASSFFYKQATLKIFNELQTQSEIYKVVNPTNSTDFDNLIGKDLSAISSQEIVPLIPHLKLALDPPEIFEDLNKLKKLLDPYQEAKTINIEELNKEIIELFNSIGRNGELFLSFYSSLREQFTPIFNHDNPLDITTEDLTPLIPKVILEGASIKTVIKELILLNKKIKIRACIIEATSTQKQEELEALKRSIFAKKENFIKVNPLKGKLFDDVMTTEHAYDIKKTDLTNLKIIPKSPSEEIPIYKQLKEFYNLVVKLEKITKESKKLEKVSIDTKITLKDAPLIDGFYSVSLEGSDDGRSIDSSSTSSSSKASSLGGRSLLEYFEDMSEQMGIFQIELFPLPSYTDSAWSFSMANPTKKV